MESRVTRAAVFKQKLLKQHFEEKEGDEEERSAKEAAVKKGSFEASVAMRKPLQKRWDDGMVEMVVNLSDKPRGRRKK